MHCNPFFVLTDTARSYDAASQMAAANEYSVHNGSLLYYVEEVGQLKSHIPLSDSSVLQFS